MPYTQGADFTFGNVTFGAFRLTEISDPNNYSYLGYVLDLMHTTFFII